MIVAASSFAPTADPRRRRLLDDLTAGLGLDAALLERAQMLGGRMDRPLEQVLNQMGAVSDQDLVRAYAQASGCEVWDPACTTIADLASLGVQARFLADHRILPLAGEGEFLSVAMCDPLDDEALAGLAFATGRPIRVLVASPADYRRAAHGLQGAEIADQPALDDARLEVEAQKVSDVGADSEAARLLTAALEAATARQASDIHLEPRRHDARLRLRVDGRLEELRTASQDAAAAAIARIKVLAGLDLGERRLPQDGRATFVVEGRPLEARVSIIPTVFGESAVLRILDRIGLRFDLEALGVADAEAGLLRAALRANHGIFFIAGPTGSGKTTTLYALLNALAPSGKKILSVEDPVEHHFAHVNQVQVAPQIQLTFATALRAFLRQDPDVILVGEVRDQETALVAVQAAMTGHLVLASVHANDAVRVIPRLLDMGVEPYQLAASLLGCAAQRLVRRLCPHCRVRRAPNDAERLFLEELGQDPATEVWAAGACDRCAGGGFRGRLALVEGFLCDDPVLSAITRREALSGLHDLAAKSGYRPMARDGIAKAQSGLTTLGEVMGALTA